MYLKKHTNTETEILAICDDTLLGTTLRGEGTKFEISEQFFKGSHTNKEEVIQALLTSNCCTLVGKETIQLALETGIITKESILEIGNVPYALVFQL